MWIRFNHSEKGRYEKNVFLSLEHEPNIPNRSATAAAPARWFLQPEFYTYKLHVQSTHKINARILSRNGVHAKLNEFISDFPYFCFIGQVFHDIPEKSLMRKITYGLKTLIFKVFSSICFPCKLLKIRIINLIFLEYKRIPISKIMISIKSKNHFLSRFFFFSSVVPFLFLFDLFAFKKSDFLSDTVFCRDFYKD